MKLTDATIAKITLAPGKNEQTFTDDDLANFGLRMRASGVRAWVVTFRVGGRLRKVTLGDPQSVKAAAARRKAEEIMAKAKLDLDLNAVRLTQRERVAETVKKMVDQYLEHHARPRQPASTLREMERYLLSYWRPLHELAAGSVGRRHVASGLLDIAREHGEMAANRARAHLQACFTWAMRQGMVETNPVIGTAKPAAERSRDRVLSGAKLREVWQACREDDYGRIVRLLMLTGQRREEVAAMRWSEFDLKRHLWVIPAERSKNGRAHEVPLSTQVNLMLSGIAKRVKRDLVFGEGEGPFSGWSQSKVRLDARIQKARADIEAEGGSETNDVKAMADWLLHDLRRSVVTGMAELGIAPHVVEAVVNHVSGHKSGVAGVCNRATYAVEKKTAMQVWADHIGKVIGDGEAKVVVLRCG